MDFGGDIGVWVLNKQTPNRQLWLSSPISGPHRFDYNITQNTWIETRDNSITLQNLLVNEWSKVLNANVTFEDDF